MYICIYIYYYIILYYTILYYIILYYIILYYIIYICTIFDNSQNIVPCSCKCSPKNTPFGTVVSGNHPPVQASHSGKLDPHPSVGCYQGEIHPPFGCNDLEHPGTTKSWIPMSQNTTWISKLLGINRFKCHWRMFQFFVWDYFGLI